MSRSTAKPPLDPDAAVVSVMKQMAVLHDAIMAEPSLPEDRVSSYLGLTRRLYALEFYRKTGEWRP